METPEAPHTDSVPAESPVRPPLRERRRILRRFAEWETLLKPGEEDPWFAGWREMPTFQPGTTAFSAVNAWWTAELCRIAYAPDHVEAERIQHRRRPRRAEILAERTRFRETHSVHKSGNHAAIYLWEKAGGDRSGEPTDAPQQATVLCFRGTSKLRQWILNTLYRPHRWKRFPAPGADGDYFVHSGFYVIFKRLWPRLVGELENCPRPWIFTGHSLGGALACIAAMVARPDAVHTFGAPKVGNAPLLGLLGDIPCHRIINRRDLVPHLPLRDARLGARNFASAEQAIYLDGGGRTRVIHPERFGTPRFDLREATRDMKTPPPWLVDHLAGNYCAKLKELALET